MTMNTEEILIVIEHALMPMLQHWNYFVYPVMMKQVGFNRVKSSSSIN